ncbi:hypothetical protein JR316_0006101 [Psilocybe cubensis]|nr:hypothetical protein JR316_0006101 [Psilocybe cubensis]KAH9481574.1 hypothetical protein JR316_0006101 [Psilocybe cubensis]
MDIQINSLANGPDLVRKHLPKLRRSSELSPRIRSDSDDDVRSAGEYAFANDVKSDALFSYQPPFNILAFLILKPLSYTLTPRALHSTNVFLIKLTSLPHLFLIGAYERYLVSASASVDGGGRGGGGGKRAVGTLFHRLPRQIKYMPFVEALVGSSAGELYDAIFELCEDGEGEYSIFGEDAEDGEGGGGGRPALRSVDSRETVADAHVGRKKAGARRSRSRSMNPKSRVRGPAGFDQQQQQPLVNIVSADSEAPSISPVLATTTTTATTRPHPRQRATSAMSPSTPVHHSDYPHVSASGSGTALASTASAGGGGVGAAPAAGAAGAGGAGVTTLSPPDSPSVVLTTERSPLMRLFGSRFPSLTSSTSSASAAQLHGGGVFPPSASNESALNVSTGAGGGAGLSVQTQNLNPNLAAHSHSHSHAQAQAAQAVQAQAAQVTQAVQAAQSTEASVKHIEALLETVGKLPVYKLKEEMKELQDRQARIENLLLMLTRGMRNEASLSATPHRQSTL